MRPIPIVLLAHLLLLSPVLARADTPTAQGEETRAAARVSVAALAFTGEDKELGRFLAETVMTDLGQSEQLQTIEATEVVRALESAGLSKSPSLSGDEVRTLGEALKADRLIIGSYLERDGQILINARLIDFKEGVPVPGSAMNVAGDRHDLLGIVHRLTRQLHKRVTGHDLLLSGSAPEGLKAPSVSASLLSPFLAPASVPPVEDILTPLRAAGLVPARARPAGILNETELGGLVGRLARHLGTSAANAVTLMQPNAPVSRLRALAALIKIAVPAERLADLKETEVRFPADAATIASWGRPYVAAAIDQGWITSDSSLRPKEGATWAFLAGLIKQMNVLDTQPHRETLASLPGDAGVSSDVETFTGLVIDARDLRIQRAMGPRILDEAGHVVYPDPRHIPDIDYLQDHGMADYDSSLETAARAGKHPLVVKALSAPEPGRDDVIISNEDAEKVRAANRRTHFMSHWSISILTSSN